MGRNKAWLSAGYLHSLWEVFPLPPPPPLWKWGSGIAWMMCQKWMSACSASSSEVTWIDECLAKPEAVDIAERKGVLAEVWLCGPSAYRWSGRMSPCLCHVLWEDVSWVSARRVCSYNYTWKPLLAQSRPEQFSNPGCSTFAIPLVSFSCNNVIAAINNKLTGCL